ncbi:MAG TPA: glutamyl-tRNA reductase [Flavitalea sp.]|nr:glutamyl-tRNA reductase [Flavitalea sp.]
MQVAEKMIETGTSDISRFYAIGINYKKTDATTRSLFAINHDQYKIILDEAAKINVHELFVLSTCNRTEIYGVAVDAEQLLGLVSKQSTGDPDLFRKICYIHQGIDAIRHLFEVGAGLDSQILGDYEIIGQIKSAVKFSREHQCIGPFIDRMVNAVLQASKQIKNDTELSGGTVSVSYAAVQFIKNNFSSVIESNILLIGTGKIGGNTCRNLQHYLPVKNITLLNRSDHKALQLAEELNVSFASYSQLQEEISKADIIIVATNATEPVITSAELSTGASKLIIDLSIPYNVDPSVSSLQNIRLVNVDELSKVKDETLLVRAAEIPKATAIIDLHLVEFLSWNEKRKYVPFLRAAKLQLQQIHTTHIENSYVQHSVGTEKIQQVINGMAVKMQEHRNHGCQYLAALNEFMTPGVES